MHVNMLARTFRSDILNTIGDSNSAAFASALAEGMDGFACGSRDRADGRYL